jgi:DNA-binding NtrC family response regulator
MKRRWIVRWFKGELPDSSFERLRDAHRKSSIKTRLMVFLIPPIIFLMAITGYINYSISKDFINNAIKRSSHLQVMALRHELESFLDRWRDDTLGLSRNSIDENTLRSFLTNNSESNRPDYLMVEFISQNITNNFAFVAKDNHIAQLLLSNRGETTPIPLIYYEKLSQLSVGEVWLSPVSEISFSFPLPDAPHQRLVRKVIHMGTPCIENGETVGYLLVTVDAVRLRNTLSLYNSDRSPIWAYPRTAEERYFFLFDVEGWILFQSESVDKPQSELSTHLARSGYTGTLGRQGLDCAFRPDSVSVQYWSMVESVRQDRHDSVLATSFRTGSFGKDYILAYAPIRFQANPNKPSEVIAGVSYMDISRLTTVAGYKQLDTMLIVTAIATIGVVLLILILARVITRPLLKLAEAVIDRREDSDPEIIALPYNGKEIAILKNAINTMISTMKRQVQELRQKDRTIRNANLKEQAELEMDFPVMASGNGTDTIPSIVGVGSSIEKLKYEIFKAAKVDADVLIMGETGTGKQLAAEAIHGLSARCKKPIISINCGAIDENLLLDTLFGHVKGAFTEAKTDRRGAFLEAHQGTLFLDEIQSASPKVQQAMLRTIAQRKIKPVGSDHEIDVDVRLIVATNVDLKKLIEEGTFREDLYFRLKVITVHPPPLREQKENIPILVLHFLKLQEKISDRPPKGLSKGALSKLMRYDWPGNVRELQNCVTRAMVMVEGDLIQAEDIHLEVEDWHDDNSFSPMILSPAEQMTLPEGLNPRQQRAYVVILERGRITRGEYQSLIGGNLPSRTAIYDLQDLVRKGILEKIGSGPATHYRVILDKEQQ